MAGALFIGALLVLAGLLELARATRDFHRRGLERVRQMEARRG